MKSLIIYIPKKFYDVDDFMNNNYEDGYLKKIENHNFLGKKIKTDNSSEEKEKGKKSETLCVSESEDMPLEFSIEEIDKIMEGF